MDDFQTARILDRLGLRVPKEKNGAIRLPHWRSVQIGGQWFAALACKSEQEADRWVQGQIEREKRVDYQFKD